MKPAGDVDALHFDLIVFLVLIISVELEEGL